jgi:hypothetical protein
METEKTVSEIDELGRREAAAKSRARTRAVGVEERELEINRDYDSQKS